ncbi:hypothetical protein Tco_0091049 [Tanacetum coccineum]
MDSNAFIRTADPRKVRIVERARAKNEGPIVTVAKHRTVTLLSTSGGCPSRRLSVGWREFVGDASVGGGGDEGVASIDGQDNVEPIVPITDNVETEIPGPKCTKKRGLPAGVKGRLPLPIHQPLVVSLLEGVPALPTLPYITSSVTASPLEEGGDHTNSVTGAKSADPEVDSLVRSAVSVMTKATTVTTIATTVSIPADWRAGSGFAAGSIRAEEVTDAGLGEIYVPEWTVTKGFELNDRRSCANMIDHFTPLAFFKTIREMEHEQLFAEFNVSAAHNLSLSSEVTSLESIIAEKDRELSDLGASSSSLRSQNQSLINQVHELETSSTDLREEVECMGIA